MRKSILSILILAAAFTASAQISASGRVYLETGALNSYSSPSIYISPSYNPFLQQVVCRLTITAPASTIPVAEITVVLDKSTVDAKTGSGTGDTAKFYNAVNQCIKDWLEAIPDNSSTTFTL